MVEASAAPYAKEKGIRAAGLLEEK